MQVGQSRVETEHLGRDRVSAVMSQREVQTETSRRPHFSLHFVNPKMKYKSRGACHEEMA